MDPNTFPTKGNLILAKNSLALAKQGYELMDKKRNILIKELMNLMEQAKDIQSEIDITFSEAYKALQHANIKMGIHNVEKICHTIPIDNNIIIKSRSIMGTEIPLVEYNHQKEFLPYSLYETSIVLDMAYKHFKKVKLLTIRLSMIENSAIRLATSIRKTQKRANALQNITIPRYTEFVTSITNSLEEKEREEFIRLKIIKKTHGS